jgi:hypothetical protein
MAWRNGSRLTGKHVKGMFRKWRRPPPPDCPMPHSIPTSIMRTLQRESLSANQINERLQELLIAYKQNGGRDGEAY